MRTLTYGAAVSLDGFLAGVNGSIDWLHFSKDMHQVMTDYWKNVGTILMGRKTYAVSVAENPKWLSVLNRPCEPMYSLAPSRTSTSRASIQFFSAQQYRHSAIAGIE